MNRLYTPMFWFLFLGFGRFISKVYKRRCIIDSFHRFVAFWNEHNILFFSSLFTKISMEMKTIPQLENFSSAPMPLVKAHMKKQSNDDEERIPAKKNTKNEKNKLWKSYISNELSFIESLIRISSTWIMDHGPYELTITTKICESTLYGFQFNTFIRFFLFTFLSHIFLHCKH